MRLILFLFVTATASAASLDCQSIGDAIENSACAAGKHQSCAEASKGAVTSIMQVRGAGPLADVSVRELRKDKGYLVSYKQKGVSRTSKVEVKREKTGCAVVRIF